MTSALAEAVGPVVAVSDFMRAVPSQISRRCRGDYTSLGTDGFGFADTRGALLDGSSTWTPSPSWLAVLEKLARTGQVHPSLPGQAITKYKLDLPVSEALG